MPTPEILAHLVDVHCHPTVAPVIATSTIESLPCTLCAMSSREGDQSMVAALARACPDRIVPGFGYHPWWAHRISLSAPAGTVPDYAAHYRALFLPESSSSSQSSSAELEEAFARLLPNLPPPISLADVLADVRVRLTEFPTAMLGEVGIDRAARIPWAGTVDAASSVGGTNGRTLSPFSTPFAHQLAILEAQLALAVELRRNVSLHSVKASAQTRELFDKMAAMHGAAWFAISVDVHSCTLSPEVWLGIEVRPFYLHFPPPPLLLVALPSPTPQAKGGTSTDAYYRSSIRMHTCHSRRLSIAVHPVTLPSSERVRQLAFLSSPITMMHAMRRHALGTWRVSWRIRTGGQLRMYGKTHHL